MYLLAHRLSIEADQLKISARYESDKKRLFDLLAQGIAKDHSSKILTAAFWINLQHEFQLFGKPSVGIRKEWMVTWSDTHPNNGMPPFFGS
jgi:hypothetical protein